MPLQSTSGSASYDAFGGGAAAKVNYIEDCFVSWLSTGNGTSRTVTGPDMTTGGLSITKSRSAATGWHFVDTARGAGNSLSSNTTAANASESTGVTAFTATGTSIGAAAEYNTSGATYVDYLLKKQPKFFDVVTYTGNGVAGRTVAHNLGSVPGCMFVKCLDTIGTSWYGYHRSLGATYRIILEQTSAASVSSLGWNNTEPTSTEFTVSANGNVNGNGKTYVAYLFAHNAGGFGLTGTDNVISCGSYTGNGSATGPSINLGYEPQWLLVKSSTQAYNWLLIDTMRGMPVGGSNAQLEANNSNAEAAGGTYFSPTATGFNLTSTSAQVNQSGQTYIYIAIRRGPMKVPTSGTSVYGTATWTGSAGTKPISSPSTNFATGYAAFIKARDYGQDWGVLDQLRGTRPFVSTDSTMAEINDGASTGGITVWPQTIWLNGGSYFGGGGDGTGKSYISYLMRRAPSFFDEVCYTGDGSSYQIVQHNLGVLAELAIVKRRSSTADWAVGILGGYNLLLNTTAATTSAPTNGMVIPNWNVNQIALNDGSGSTSNNVNASGSTYVAYLFATCAGVSKVGSYTGTGTTKQVDCGFTGGARFVLIKRTDSTGSWYVWDVARGISSGNDPYLLLNSTAAEVTNTDYIDAYSAGFEISSTAPAEINASGGSFIFLAIS